MMLLIQLKEIRRKFSDSKHIPATGSGKTTFISRMLDKPVREGSTSGVHKHEVTTSLLLENSHVDCRIELWEGNGEDTLLAPDKAQINSILEGCNAIILLLDTSQADGVKKADRFLTLVTELLGLSAAACIPMLLLGTKRDAGSASSLNLSDVQMAAEEMGLLCAVSRPLLDPPDKLLNNVRVLANSAHDWAEDKAKVGVYSASYVRFGILNADKEIRFRQGRRAVAQPGTFRTIASDSPQRVEVSQPKSTFSIPNTSAAVSSEVKTMSFEIPRADAEKPSYQGAAVQAPAQVSAPAPIISSSQVDSQPQTGTSGQSYLQTSSATAPRFMMQQGQSTMPQYKSPIQMQAPQSQFQIGFQPGRIGFGGLQSSQARPLGFGIIRN